MLHETLKEWNIRKNKLFSLFLTTNALPHHITIIITIKNNTTIIQRSHQSAHPSNFPCSHIWLQSLLSDDCPAAHWLANSVENHGISWWRHQLGIFSTLPALCEGNLPVTGGFPSQRPVARSFDVLFYLRLNTRLCKQSRRWWFETPSRALWRHHNVWLNCVNSQGLIVLRMSNSLSTGGRFVINWHMVKFQVTHLGSDRNSYWSNAAYLLWVLQTIVWGCNNVNNEIPELQEVSSCMQIRWLARAFGSDVQSR